MPCTSRDDSVVDFDAEALSRDDIRPWDEPRSQNEIAAVNRVGQEDEMTFYGGSFISNPYGDVLARGNSESDQIVEAEINVEQIRAFRNIFQFHRDRRPETYRELLKVVID